MKLGEFDPSGRRRPELDDAALDLIPADQVIVAIGQKLKARPLGKPLDLELTERGWIKADPRTGRTSIPWLFAGGDAVSGPSSVVEAIAAGERAAAGIDEALTGERHAFWRRYRDVSTGFDPDADPSSDPREKLPAISVEKRRHNFAEVELPWSESTAVRQARRCLRCDYGKPACAAAEDEERA